MTKIKRKKGKGKDKLLAKIQCGVGCKKWDTICGKLHRDDEDLASVQWKDAKPLEREAKLEKAYQDYFYSSSYVEMNLSVRALALRWGICPKALGRKLKEQRAVRGAGSKRTVTVSNEIFLKLRNSHANDLRRKDKMIQSLHEKVKEQAREHNAKKRKLNRCNRQFYAQSEAELILFHADEVKKIKQRQKKKVNSLLSEKYEWIKKFDELQGQFKQWKDNKSKEIEEKQSQCDALMAQLKSLQKELRAEKKINEDLRNRKKKAQECSRKVAERCKLKSSPINTVKNNERQRRHRLHKEYLQCLEKATATFERRIKSLQESHDGLKSKYDDLLDLYNEQKRKLASLSHQESLCDLLGPPNGSPYPFKITMMLLEMLSDMMTAQDIRNAISAMLKVISPKKVIGVDVRIPSMTQLHRLRNVINPLVRYATAKAIKMAHAVAIHTDATPVNGRSYHQTSFVLQMNKESNKTIVLAAPSVMTKNGSSEVELEAVLQSMNSPALGSGAPEIVNDGKNVVLVMSDNASNALKVSEDLCNFFNDRHKHVVGRPLTIRSGCNSHKLCLMSDSGQCNSKSFKKNDTYYIGGNIERVLLLECAQVIIAHYYRKKKVRGVRVKHTMLKPVNGDLPSALSILQQHKRGSNRDQSFSGFLNGLAKLTCNIRGEATNRKHYLNEKDQMLSWISKENATRKVKGQEPLQFWAMQVKLICFTYIEYKKLSK